MTYFSVLALFILPPIMTLLIFISNKLRPRLLYWRSNLRLEPYMALLVLILIVLIYTTPWDNYLVAEGVWRYDPQLVSGVLFGWVPLEEYIFFVMQTLLTGLWCLALMHNLRKDSVDLKTQKRLRIGFCALVALIWVASIFILIQGSKSVRYLALILIWALPPLFLQLIIGADILLNNQRLLLYTILPITIYLWAVDAIAIKSGTWTINARQTTGIVFGPLPLEEMLFFLMTNLLIAFGMILMLSAQSKRRLKGWFIRFSLRTNRQMDVF